MKKEVSVMESVYSKNNAVAGVINDKLTRERVFAVNVLGSPGAGKTSSLEQIIKRLGILDCAVIEGDIESDIDTIRLKQQGINAAQINTGGACHLDAASIRDIVERMSLRPGYLFIENIGNLICPVPYQLGERMRLLISNATEGADKPYKYPYVFEKADIVLLNKCDLIEHVDFDTGYFLDGIRKLNPDVPVFKVSCKTGEGFDEVAEWITRKAEVVIGK